METKRTTMTLREICNYLDIDLPEKYKSIADEEQTLSFNFKASNPGDIYLAIRSFEEYHFKKKTSKDQYENAISQGAKLVIMGKDAFNSCGLKEDECSVILLDDPQKSIASFFNKLRRVHKRVVMLTGSIGKTTTKDICSTIAERNFHSFANVDNSNTPVNTARHLLNESLDPREVYIQEAGAGYRTSVELASEMLTPDIFILTNVYGHHMQMFKTFVNIFIEKVSPDDNMSPNGVIITNYDDENIREYYFKHKVISFAIDNDNVDYKANNLVQNKDLLSFDIFERKTNTNTHVEVKLLGKHNAYNVLAAFALGRVLGISCEKLVEDLKFYRPEGVRQHLKNIGGVTINMDCYNVSEESIISMLEAGENYPLKDGGKRIALIGGENKLGKNMKSRSRAFGKQLADISFDRFLFCGTEDESVSALKHFGDAQDIYKGFKKVSEKECELLLDLNQITESLRQNVKKNDLLMAKGIYYLNMPIAVDKVFGTSFSYDLIDNLRRTVTIEEDIYTVSLIPEMEQVVIKSIECNDGILIVPNSVASYPVIRIAPEAFSSRPDIREVHLGTSINNIGRSAFKACANISELIIPKNVLVIESNAFSGCSKLSSVILESGVTHISEGAFADCGALKTISIPDSVGMIEENAFENCDVLKIRCSKDSFAHKYAESNNIEFELV